MFTISVNGLTTYAINCRKEAAYIYDHLVRKSTEQDIVELAGFGPRCGECAICLNLVKE